MKTNVHYRNDGLERPLRALLLAAIAILARRSPASIKRRIATGSLYRKTTLRDMACQADYRMLKLQCKVAFSYCPSQARNSLSAASSCLLVDHGSEFATARYCFSTGPPLRGE